MIHLNPGDRYGRLTIIGPAPASDRYPKKRMWHCRCDCGREVDWPASYIVHGVVTSCGCSRNQPKLDLCGKRYGRLTGVRPTGEIRRSSAVWLWQCDCGRAIEATAESVMWGGRTSCGCAQTEQRVSAIKASQAAIERVYGTNVNNIRSSKIYANNTSGVRGVYWHKASKAWCAKIGFRGRNYLLGYYRHLEDAAAARKEAEEHLFGDFLSWYDAQKESGAPGDPPQPSTQTTQTKG